MTLAAGRLQPNPVLDLALARWPCQSSTGLDGALSSLLGGRVILFYCLVPKIKQFTAQKTALTLHLHYKHATKGF